MFRTKKWASLTIGAFVVLVFAPAVYAVPLGAFGDVSLPITGAVPAVTGTVLAVHTSSFNDGSGTIGFVDSAAVNDQATGKLDFFFDILNTTPLPSGSTPFEQIVAFRTIDYSAFPTVDVNFNDHNTVFTTSPCSSTGPACGAPDEVKRVGSNGLEGVNFLFNHTTIGNGEGSVEFFIRTNATQFHLGPNADLLISPTGSQTDTHLSGLFDVYAPGAPVPEPGTLLLMSSGLTGLAFWRLARRS